MGDEVFLAGGIFDPGGTHDHHPRGPVEIHALGKEHRVVEFSLPRLAHDRRTGDALKVSILPSDKNDFFNVAIFL